MKREKKKRNREFLERKMGGEKEREEIGGLFIVVIDYSSSTIFGSYKSLKY